MEYIIFYIWATVVIGVGVAGSDSAMKRPSIERILLVALWPVLFPAFFISRFLDA